MRIVYHVLFACFFLVSLPYYFFRLWRRGNWRKGVGQRFGFYGKNLKRDLEGKRVIWFHAVSVGEVNLCAHLVKACALEDWTVVVSTTTTTGMGELMRKLPEDVFKIYYPVDLFFSVRQALNVIRPQLVVLVEAEIWPNMLWSLADRGVPTFLMNARLSDRSARRYCQFPKLFNPLFSSFHGVGVQNEADAARLVSVGCRTDRVVVTGNLKFDAVDLTSMHTLQPRELIRWAGASPDSLVLLGSSTHAGEERVLGSLYLDLRERVPNLFLVIVPRHFERGAEVLRDLESLGLQCRFRSHFGSDGMDAEGAGDCLIVDSTGELRFFYDAASVVFVGKSLLAHGGQNPIEPAAAGCAVVMGPNMENFRAITSAFLSAQSMVQVKDEAELREELERLLSEDDARRILGERAQAVVNRNRGAVQRTVEMIEAAMSEINFIR